MKLNKKIYEYRKLNRWSQEDLADKLNVSRQTISKWEVGKNVPELDKLLKLSEIFNISVDELVKEEIDIVSKKESAEILKETIVNYSEEKLNENIEEKRKIKNTNKKGEKILKLIIVFLIILILIVLGMVCLQKRKLQIREIAKVYREEFRDDNDNITYIATEHVSRKENNVITESYRKYYIYKEKDKLDLIKINEYEDADFNNLTKQIYLDGNNGMSFIYDDGMSVFSEAIEIDVKTWEKKILKDYEIILPTERIKNVFQRNYFDWGRAKAEKKLALDFHNYFSIIKHNEAGTGYWWRYGEEGNLNKEDFFDINILSEAKQIFFIIDDYKNDIADTREIVNIQLGKIPGNKEDVIVPEEE